MSSLSSQDHLLLPFHSRRLLFHIPLHQSKPEDNPPATVDHHHPLDPYSGQSSFDANVIFVLLLIMCALLCSIGAKFIIKFALRCLNSTPSIPESTSAQVPNTGIEKKVLKMFTTLKYSEELKLPGLDSDCAICLSEFRNGERVRILPKCNHGFHMRCIDRWLNQHSSCPTCRNCLIGTCQKILISSQGSLPAPTPETREIVLTITPLEREGFVCN